MNIEFLKQFTTFDFSAETEVIDSSIRGILDQTFYMILKTDNSSIESLIETKAPFSEEWRHGPIPEELRFGLFFGPNMKVDGFGKKKAYGDKKIIELLDSNQLIWSIEGNLFDPPRILRSFIIDSLNNKIYVGYANM